MYAGLDVEEVTVTPPGTYTVLVVPGVMLVVVILKPDIDE